MVRRLGTAIVAVVVTSAFWIFFYNIRNAPQVSLAQAAAAYVSNRGMVCMEAPCPKRCGGNTPIGAPLLHVARDAHGCQRRVTEQMALLTHYASECGDL